MKVMVVSPYLPHAKVGHGGGTAVRDLIKHLAHDHDVLLVSLVRSGENTLIAEVEELGVSVAAIPFADTQISGFDRLALLATRTASFLRGVVSGYPHYVQKYWSKDISEQILKIASEFKPDAVQIEYLQMALYARDLKRARKAGSNTLPRIILNSHELGSVPRHRRAARATFIPSRWWYRKEASQWVNLQVAACHWADRILCVTEEDRLLYEAMGGSNLLTVPLGMDLEAVKPDRQQTQPPSCLFVGSFNHRPNVLAADLLINDIWPRVREQFPEAELILAGRGSRQHLEQCTGASTGVSATGFVEDLAPLFRDSALFVAPLPEGGGIKIKILEAMARGIPVVTTAVGAEGITSEDEDTIVITDPFNGFAGAIIKALDDPETEARALRARLLMDKNFGWKAIAARLGRIYLGEE